MMDLDCYLLYQMEYLELDWTKRGLIKTPNVLLVDYVNDIDPSTVTKWYIISKGSLFLQKCL